MWLSYSVVIHVFSFVSIWIPVWVPISWLALIIYLGVCEGYVRHYCDFKSQSHTKNSQKYYSTSLLLTHSHPLLFLSFSFSQSCFSFDTIFLYFFCTNRLCIFCLFAYKGWYAIFSCFFILQYVLEITTYQFIECLFCLSLQLLSILCRYTINFSTTLLWHLGHF